MKKGNKGFSLIEVMVAITILAIIVTPFLASFLRTTKINAKSRKMFRATTVAENVMEGLSGFTIEDISEQFNDIYEVQKVDASGNPVVDGAGNPVKESKFLILNNRDGEDAITHREISNEKVNVGTPEAPVEIVSLSVNGGAFSQKPSNIYEYVLQNVTEDRQKFDIKVTVDANQYRDVTAEKLQSGQDYNIAAGKMFNVAEMNPRTDIVWAEPEGMEDRYKDDYIEAMREQGEMHFNVEEAVAQVVADTNFLSNCYREFALYIDNKTVECKVYLYYEPLHRGYELGSSKKFFPSITDEIKRKNLKNIFLCYYPKYQLKKDVIQIKDFTGVDPDDQFNVEINDDYSYNLYLIKQEKDSMSNYQETNYKVDLNIYLYIVDLNEFIIKNTGVPYFEEVEFVYPFSIRGNLGHYFEKENPAPGEPQGLISDQVTIKMDYGLGDISVVEPRLFTTEELEKMDIFDGVIRYSGIDKSTKNLIYYTTVDVYEAGAATINADGTYSFDESKHVAKLDSEQAEIH